MTRPKNVTKTFELSLKDAIHARLAKSTIQSSVFGVTRLESHAFLLLQLVDVLLGAVVYDFKKAEGIIAPKLVQRQEPVVEMVRKSLGTTSLAVSRTYNSPSYFSVWKFNQGK